MTGAAFWHFDADEPSAPDYSDYNQPLLFNSDRFRTSDHDPVLVGICETTPPVVDVLVAPDTLWPPNHKYVTVNAALNVTDADPNATVTLVSLTSNEPDSTGKGDEPNDIVIVDDTTFELRAERAGDGAGRIYTVTYEVTDACGNSTTVSAQVNVPHDQREEPKKEKKEKNPELATQGEESGTAGASRVNYDTLYLPMINR